MSNTAVFGIIRGVKLAKIAEWLDNALCVADFDDVSNNGLQLARAHGEVRRAAVAVDASLRAVEVAAEIVGVADIFLLALFDEGAEGSGLGGRSVECAGFRDLHLVDAVELVAALVVFEADAA